MMPQQVELSGSDLSVVIVIAAIAAIAVAMSMVFRAQVLKARDGTENMRLIEALNRIPAQQQKAIRRFVKALAEVEPAAEADD